MSTKNPHDAFFKAVFSQPQEAIAHFQAFLPPQISALLDLDSATLCPGSFVDELLSDRHTDLLYRCEVNGRPAFLYLLFEHQSTPDGFMVLRLFIYMGRIWDKWCSDHPKARRVPAILPMVLYHGETGWSAPLTLLDTLDLDPQARRELGPFMVDLNLMLFDLSVFDDAELRRGALGGLALLLMKHIRDGDLLRRIPQWAQLLCALARRPDGLRMFEIVIRYILAANPNATPQTMSKTFEQSLDKESNEMATTAGQCFLEEYGREARREASLSKARNMLRRQLEVKFGELPPRVTRLIESADEAQLDKWIERIFVIARPDDLFTIGDPPR